MSRPAPVIVVGSDDLALRTIISLVEHYHVPVTAVVTGGRSSEEITLVPGVRVLRADRVDDEVLSRAGVAEAGAIALLERDDAVNLQAALVAQDLHPAVRTVIRTFNLALASRVSVLLNDAVALSDSDIAASAWVEAALGALDLEPVRIGATELWVEWRTDVPPEAIVTGLGKADGGLLGRDKDADIVLTRYAGPLEAARLARRRAVTGGRPPRFIRIRRPYLYMLGGLVLFFVVASVLLASLEGQSLGDAFLSSLLALVGQESIDINESSAALVVRIILAVISVAFVPAIAAAVVDVVVSARLASASGMRRSMQYHIVLVGLGNLGTRVMRRMVSLGFTVVGVERDEQSRGAGAARELNVPVVIGDAAQPQVLVRAQTAAARIVVLTIPDDFTNLEIALTAQDHGSGPRLVMRLRDGDFADRLYRAFGLRVSRNAERIAAAAFAHALVCHEPVIRVMALGRRVLLFATVLVEADSPLSGVLLSSVNAAGLVKVLGVQSADTDTALLQPPDRRIEAGLRIIVVATQAGLADLLGRARSLYA
ncbi:NAD-binding protein [Hamadaea tsunoensis]|uniref:NAD-binding protein n=1 Tax=Hamadaea tsunoensis TaxID=53368 RepID=UPI0004251F46|nr:NAD-binding protein [Hamadaea tsunoensis]